MRRRRQAAARDVPAERTPSGRPWTRGLAATNMPAVAAFTLRSVSQLACWFWSQDLAPLAPAIAAIAHAAHTAQKILPRHGEINRYAQLSARGRGASPRGSRYSKSGRFSRAG